jgi:hypothetical protein
VLGGASDVLDHGIREHDVERLIPEAAHRTSVADRPWKRVDETGEGPTFRK